MMMNKEQSSKIRLITYTLLLPLVMLLLVANNAQALASKLPTAFESITNSTLDDENKITVSGQVINDQNQPIPGVTIVVIGTHMGTLSNMEGKFSLQCDKNSKLMFSYIGKNTVTVPVVQTTKEPLIITMIDKIEMLDEVNVGDTEQEPKNITVTLGLEKNEKSLYIIDGEKSTSSQAKKIDPRNIEQVAVLKDASAIKVYGERGENGVVLITTKKEQKSTQQNREQPTALPDDSEPIFTVVEQMPQFPGGTQAMFTYLKENTKYPKEAQKQGIRGRVVCSFVVEKDGSIAQVNVKQGIDPLLDAEAVRVIQNMPRWSPGKQRGKEVTTKYHLPIAFGREDSSSPQQKSTESGKVKRSGENFSFSSLHPEKAPLVLLDGKEIPHTNLNTSVPVEIIESFSILKDSSATKIYGEKGKNGVIIIVSKKEKED